MRGQRKPLPHGCCQSADNSANPAEYRQDTSDTCCKHDSRADCGCYRRLTRVGFSGDDKSRSAKRNTAHLDEAFSSWMNFQRVLAGIKADSTKQRLPHAWQEGALCSVNYIITPRMDLHLLGHYSCPILGLTHAATPN